MNYYNAGIEEFFRLKKRFAFTYLPLLLNIAKICCLFCQWMYKDLLVSTFSPHRKKAFQLIILFGVVSLFGDIVYEGARSVNGPYLKILGANAAMVGIIAGIAEFLGYAIRLFSGYFSDKTRSYWLFTIIGYAMLISVPMLSLTSVWQFAALLIVMERLGKALRSPAKDTILSQATKQVGTGFGFGLHEAMDQIGAIAGPLFFSGLFVLLGSGEKGIVDYQSGYSLLWIPFLLVMFSVLVAYIRFPNPEKLERPSDAAPESNKLTRIFWLYTAFSFVATVGFTNFAIIGYHFKTQHILTDAQIPLFYAIAMGIDAVVALIIGKIYDKVGLVSLMTVPLFTFLIPVFAFSKKYTLVIVGIIIWGIVMGTHETIMKAAIADLTSVKKRGTGYGIFNTAYGLAMFIGSSVMGILYEVSINAVITFSIVIEALAIPLFFIMKKAVANQP